MSDDDKYRRYAEKIKIFHGLTGGDVEYILHHGKIHVFREGETIFHEGQLGSNLFIILSGKIAIYKKNKLVATCTVGDAFGEMAVLNHAPRCATAASLVETRLFTLDEVQINGILEKHLAVKLLLNIIHMLSERLETVNTKLAGLLDS